MKKLFFTLFTVLAAGTAAFSQTKGMTEFGIGAGVNITTVTNDDDNADSRVGLNVSVSADHYFSDRWSLKLKAGYDQKGWANGFLMTPTATIVTDYRLDYVTIPVLANWHFGRTRKWYLNFGPYAAVLVNAKTTANDFDVKPFFNEFDGGLDVGIGVKLPIAEKVKFFIEYNGQGGVASIAKGDGPSLRNSVSAFNVGLNF